MMIFFTISLQEISFLAATFVVAKNAKLLQKVFFAAKKNVAACHCHKCRCEKFCKDN
jgi:hypothetical protein